MAFYGLRRKTSRIPAGRPLWEAEILHYVFVHRWWHRFARTPHQLVMMNATIQGGQPHIDDLNINHWFRDHVSGKVKISIFREYFIAFGPDMEREIVLGFSSEADFILFKMTFF